MLQICKACISPTHHTNTHTHTHAHIHTILLHFCSFFHFHFHSTNSGNILYSIHWPWCQVPSVKNASHLTLSCSLFSKKSQAHQRQKVMHPSVMEMQRKEQSLSHFMSSQGQHLFYPSACLQPHNHFQIFILSIIYSFLLKPACSLNFPIFVSIMAIYKLHKTE